MPLALVMCPGASIMQRRPTPQLSVPRHVALVLSTVRSA